MPGANPLRVLGISGSLRKGSFNTAALRTAQGLLPEGMTIEPFDLAPIPLYNEDVREQGFPPVIAAPVAGMARRMLLRGCGRGLPGPTGWTRPRSRIPGLYRPPLGRCTMNWDQIEGNWKQVTGKVKEKWGKLTDDDLTAIKGKRDQLAGKLQERYGYAKDQAERELDEFARTLNAP